MSYVMQSSLRQATFLVRATVPREKLGHHLQPHIWKEFENAAISHVLGQLQLLGWDVRHVHCEATPLTCADGKLQVSVQVSRLP